MRTWIWTLLLLAVATALAVAAREHAGNVVIVVPPYRVELSIALATILVLALFVLLHFLLRTTGFFLSAPSRVRGWRDRRSARNHQERLESGWVNLLQGHYVRAEQEFVKVAGVSRHTGRRVLAALSAARSAHAMLAFDRRDDALHEARTIAGADTALQLAVACAGADMLLEEGRAADALALLEPIQQGAARHVHVQRLLLRTHYALGNWETALKLARGLARHKAMPVLAGGTQAADSMMVRTAAQALRAAPTPQACRAIWKDLKTDERVHPDVALAAAEGLVADEPREARKILEASLDRHPDPRLLAAYTRCEPEETASRLQQAESWLRKYPANPDVLYTLGALCLGGQLWGPARAYLERSLQARPSAQTHALLGSLFDRLDRPADAMRHWRLATAVAVGLTVLDGDGVLPAADTEADPQRLGAEVLDADGSVSDMAEAQSVPDDAPPARPLPPPAHTLSASDAQHDDYELGAADLPPVHVVDIEPVPPSRG